MWFLFKLSNKLFFYKGKDYMPSCFKSAEKAYLCRNNHT